MGRHSAVQSRSAVLAQQQPRLSEQELHPKSHQEVLCVWAVFLGCVFGFSVGCVFGLCFWVVILGCALGLCFGVVLLGCVLGYVVGLWFWVVCSGSVFGLCFWVLGYLLSGVLSWCFWFEKWPLGGPAFFVLTQCILGGRNSRDSLQWWPTLWFRELSFVDEILFTCGQRANPTRSQ